MVEERLVVAGSRTVTAGTDVIPVRVMGVKAIRHRDAQRSPLSEEVVASTGGSEALLEREMLPDVLGQQSVHAARAEQGLPVSGARDVQELSIREVPPPGSELVPASYDQA
jgi:hypothetical protein